MPGFFWSHSSPARVDDYRRSQVPGCSLFPHFVTIENETQAASDHAAVVVEINID